jgi:hypothetical protein
MGGPRQAFIESLLGEARVADLVQCGGVDTTPGMVCYVPHHLAREFSAFSIVMTTEMT